VFSTWGGGLARTDFSSGGVLGQPVENWNFEINNRLLAIEPDPEPTPELVFIQGLILHFLYFFKKIHFNFIILIYFSRVEDRNVVSVRYKKKFRYAFSY